MVHAVQPPQHRHRVEHHVLRIDGEVEDQKAKHRATESGSAARWNNPNPGRPRYSAAPYGRSRNEDAGPERIDHRRIRIVGQRAAPAGSPRARGARTSQPGHDGEDEARLRYANQELAVMDVTNFNMIQAQAAARLRL